MKKLIASVLALVCVLSLVGCKSARSVSDISESTATEMQESQHTTEIQKQEEQSTELVESQQATPQSENSPSQVVLPELEKTDWLAVSTDAEVFNLKGGFDNPNFEYVFRNTDTVPLDQLIAFILVGDAAIEGACERLRSRFLEAPNTVLAYLVLMGDQKVDFWDNPPAAEVICHFIATTDAAFHGGTEEFNQVIESCREIYPSGPVAELLDVMEAEHKASMERNH